MRTPRPTLFATALLLAAACTDAAPDGPTIVGAPSPSIAPFFSTAPLPAEEDSVHAGYGGPCTGGLEYEVFEYDPETGTEYIVCSDTAVKRDTTVKPTPPPPPPAP